MIKKYITKNDRNGNRYTLEVDETAKTYKLDYNPFGHYDGKVITKRARKSLIDFYDFCGFKRIF